MKQLIIITLLVFAACIQGCAYPHRGPSVPGCAQQANNRGLVGPERQHFIDQCMHRGPY